MNHFYTWFMNYYFINSKSENVKTIGPTFSITRISRTFPAINNKINELISMEIWYMLSHNGS